MEQTLVSIVVAGVLSCAAMDIWQQILQRVWGLPASNWAVVGRWFVHTLRSRSMYQPQIDTFSPEPKELPLGWLVHYLVGVAYALVFWIFLVPVPVFTATAGSGLVFGALSVAVPWFYFMPCLGKGVMASKTAMPLKACSLAVANHLVFGLAMALAFSM